MWGVQFHPESIGSEYGRQILTNFRDLSRAQGPLRPRVGWAPPPTRKTMSPTGRGAIWLELSHEIDTEAAFAQMFGDAPIGFWLDSSLADGKRSRWSYLGNADSKPTDGHDAAVALDYGSGGEQHRKADIFARLEKTLRGAPRNAPSCPFVGGRIGWFGYGLAGASQDRPSVQGSLPDALFMRVDRFIAVDHLEKRSFVIAVGDDATEKADRAWVEQTARRLTQLKPLSPVEEGYALEPVRFELNRDRDGYLRDIEQCLRWIEEGETYQVCLTNEITTETDVDAFTLNRILRRINPAPYAAFLRWPGGAVLSASPERFLRADADGRVEAKPIKSTRARDANPMRDRALAAELVASEKDRAENLMIVDLLRNDLSRVCVPGSVIVTKLCALESYATVHQLLSTIEGTLNVRSSSLDLVRAAFPGGSMTGTPKRRTLGLIDQLEGRARGLYSGALGWIGDDGATDLSIIIRTIVQADGRLSIGSGGGIVAQSDPETEFAEMLLKAHAPMRAIALAKTGSTSKGDYVVVGAEPSARPLAASG